MVFDAHVFSFSRKGGKRFRLSAHPPAYIWARTKTTLRRMAYTTKRECRGAVCERVPAESLNRYCYPLVSSKAIIDENTPEEKNQGLRPEQEVGEQRKTAERNHDTPRDTRTTIRQGNSAAPCKPKQARVTRFTKKKRIKRACMHAGRRSTAWFGTRLGDQPPRFPSLA